MTEAYHTTLSPRYFECNPDSQLHVANYLRYALQAAIEAGAAADLHAPGLDAAGWLEHVGDIGFQINKPVVFGDRLGVQTRLTRVGPPIWRREVAFQRGGETVALAFVDAFDEDESQPEMDDDVSEPVTNDNPAWDGPVPEPPEPPGHAFRAVWRAAWQHLDISGQLDPGWLTQMLGDMEGRAAEARGWPAARNQETGIAWQAMEHRLELFEPIQAGDVLNITSYIGAVGDDQMVRHALIERQDEGVNVEVARARTRWACVSTSSTERCPIPDDWLYDLADQMAE
jgi:acyl-CoA thioesterase FadM